MNTDIEQLNLRAFSSLSDEIRREGEENFVPVMKVDAASLLRQIITLRQPEKILEIGTATGFSGMIMLECAKSAHLYTIEHNESRVEKARENFKKAGLLDRATFFVGNVHELIDFVSGEFDFLFFDGPKSHYLEFLQKLRPFLKSGAVVVCDNVLFRGIVEEKTEVERRMRTIAGNMRAFLDYITGDEWESAVYDIGDGVSVSILK